MGMALGGAYNLPITIQSPLLHWQCLFWKADPRAVKIKVPQLSTAGRASCWKAHPRRGLLHPAKVRWPTSFQPKHQAACRGQGAPLGLWSLRCGIGNPLFSFVTQAPLGVDSPSSPTP